MDPQYYDLDYEQIKEIHEKRCVKIEYPRPIYAHVFDNGKIQFLKMKQVEHFFTAEYMSTGVHFAPKEKEKLFITKWLRDSSKKTCHHVVVEPNYPMGPLQDVFNIFRGFRAGKLPGVPEESVETLVQPIVQHIHDVLTAQSKEKTEWFLNWLAGLVQRPHIKHGVGVVVNGTSGCGKGVFATFFRREVLGLDCSYQSAYARRDISPKCVNGTLCAVFVQLDQELTRMTARERGTISDLITRTSFFYHLASMPPLNYKDVSNLYMTTKKTTVSTIGEFDGLLTLFQASNMYTGDTGYFSRLCEHLARPEVARAFYQFLMGRDLNDFFPGTHPSNE